VADVAALLPSLVQLEFEGRYRAMLSHEPKNYALLGYDGNLILKGVAFRSSRAEPFGHAFLRRALACLLTGDVAGVRESFVATIDALRRREVTTHDVSSRVRLTKSPERYLALREHRRESMYEAMLAQGLTDWRAGDKVRVYRTGPGWGLADADDEDRRDYDVAHYVRSLRANYATRMARAFTTEDFAAVFADPAQPSLFAPDFASLRPILTSLEPMSSTSPSSSTEP
jgi:DNA polymerase elongation subunit (family B)